MPPEIKVCGLTRATDAHAGQLLGASYLGLVLARSPRRLSVDAALRMLGELDQLERLDRDDQPGRPERGDRGLPMRGPRVARRAARVGVFAGAGVREIVGTARALELQVVQLHGAGEGRLAAALHGELDARVWVVVPVRGDAIDPHALEAAWEADGVLLDAQVGEQLGGTGHSFDWERGASEVEPLRGRRPIILAGGLRPETVADAIAAFAPDVVDVSSGVESAPGLKDVARMRAFVDAVRGVGER